jgi:hypothetical protein
MKQVLLCAVTVGLSTSITLTATALAAAAPGVGERPAPTSSRTEGTWRLAPTSTSAFGVSNAGFYNHLLGARLDYRFTPGFAFGAALAYANLKGKTGRAHNLLPEAAFEYRIAWAGHKLGIPLRFASGFLPRNGPTLRVAAGLDLALSDSASLELMLLEPMIWVNRERPEVSVNASASLRLAL